MKKENILKIKKMGMDIYKDSDLKTDLSNFRYYIHLPQENVREEFKQSYTIDTIEVMRGYKRDLKNNKLIELANNMLSINIYKYDKNGCCFGDLKLEKTLQGNDRRFNKKDLLDAINKLVINEYTTIEEVA